MGNCPLVTCAERSRAILASTFRKRLMPYVVCYLFRERALPALVLLLSSTLFAQDVGMGTRRGSGVRLEAPYTLDIETPHVKWANPLPGGPIRLLAVPTVDEGRTVVELAQRLSLDLTTVSIDSAWDVNKWTMSFGPDYGVRAERGDLRLIYSYLEQELTSAKPFDAILLPLHHGWNSLTAASREALVRRVREGCGLVLIQPLDAEISPLVPATPITMPKDPIARFDWATETSHPGSVPARTM